MILAVDPGKDKCGLAVVKKNGYVLEQNIVDTLELKSYIKKIMHKYKLKEIILGDGTYHQQIEVILKDTVSIPVKIIDEEGTTFLAEKKYLDEEVYKGWKKILKFAQWKPSRPVDDYVAIILAERYFELSDNGKK